MTTPPNRPGYYWAKSGNYKWFNLLVCIHGDAPFLKIKAWNLVEDKVFIYESSDITEWSDEISKPK